MDWWQYPVTQGFGPTGEQLDGGWGGYAHFNKGIDFGVPWGTPVRSVVSGTVISAGDSNDGWGTSVKIRDAQGNTHNLGHLSGVQVSPGQTVLAGQAVGASGNTGKSTGPHVSYDVWDPAGNYFDPSGFLAQAPGASPPMAPPDPEDQFLVEPDGVTPTGGGTLTPVGNGGLPPGFTDTGQGYAYGKNPVTGGIVYITKDPYTGEWKETPTTGLNQPYTGPPSIRHDPNTGAAYEWKDGAWVPSPMWDDPSRAQGAGVLRNVFNPQTGQTHLAVVDPKTGTVINWGDAVSAPKEPGYYNMPAAGVPGAAATSTFNPERNSGKAPNQFDALSIANMISGGMGGQNFSRQTIPVNAPAGSVSKVQDNFNQGIARNQFGNNAQILDAYGVDYSKMDPIQVAATAAVLGARQKGMVDSGYDPTFSASLIQYENNANLSGTPISYQNMSSPYSGGQTVMIGPDGHTYSEAAYRQAFG